MSGTGYPDTGVETDDLDVLAFKFLSFSSAISFNLSYKYRLNKIAARWPAKAVARFYFY